VINKKLTREGTVTSSIQRPALLACTALVLSFTDIDRAGSSLLTTACANQTVMSAAVVPLDIPDVVLHELTPPFYGVPSLFAEKPTFQKKGGGAVAYLSVWKGDDLELTGYASLPGTRHKGKFYIQKGAALRGLQHVPLVLPRKGCWRITISTARAAVSFHAKV
jgi:hypothetical protein